uniref:DHA14-like major facilitator n=1 Tax=Ganoderma boninense TaxID=34458 RepID=A0A5K1JTI8_9APHY|nr:DHA14-like major facilitator [Ganoderma boninense]
MHHHWHHAHRCGRATSRLFWFFVGAGTATWWHCHKDYHAWQYAHACGRDRIPQHAYPAPGAAPPTPTPTPATAADEQGPTPGTIDNRDRRGWGHGWGRGWGQWGNENGNGANGNGNWEVGVGQPRAEREREAGRPMGPRHLASEKAPEKDIMEQATNTIADLSEATLNNLLVTVESLKAKLAEHRAQRDQQERELQTLREAREAKFKQFEEWQRQQAQEQKQEKESPRHL